MWGLESDHILDADSITQYYRNGAKTVTDLYIFAFDVQKAS
jgi:hypothetical protein